MEPQIQHLFDQKHKLADDDLAKLDAKDQRQLIRMVKGTIAASDRTVAMDALARIAPSKAIKAISEVILDSKTPLNLRAVAATQLGRIGGAGVEENLLSSIAVEKGLVFQTKVVAALAKIGTSSSVAMLKKMDRKPQNQALRRQAQFALIMIGFRSHDKKYTPPIPSDDDLLVPKKDASVEFKACRAKSKELITIISDICRDCYGVTPSSKNGVLFDCGRNRFAMLLNNSIVEQNILAELTKPSILGIVAQQAPTDASWATRYVLLGWPGAGGRIQISGYRTDGFQVLSGSIYPQDNLELFELMAVRAGANVPAMIKGNIKGKTIVFTDLQTERRIVGKRRLKETTIPVDLV